MLDFRNNRNVHGHVFYRWLNEFPTLILIGIDHPCRRQTVLA